MNRRDQVYNSRMGRLKTRCRAIRAGISRALVKAGAVADNRAGMAHHIGEIIDHLDLMAGAPERLDDA